MAMDFNAALDRIEQALARLERAGQALPAAVPVDPAPSNEELVELKARHRKLKDSVAQELRQLDLLLAGLPK
jgi:hypothetical protein